MNYEKMPFGKYKGVKIEDLPTEYMAYALEKFDLPDELKMQILVCLFLNVKGTHIIDEYVKKIKSK